MTKPSTENVDYDSPEWHLGYKHGKAGEMMRNPARLGTQAYINYYEGWLIGYAEQDYDENDYEPT